MSPKIIFLIYNKIKIIHHGHHKFNENSARNASEQKLICSTQNQTKHLKITKHLSKINLLLLLLIYNFTLTEKIYEKQILALGREQQLSKDI